MGIFFQDLITELSESMMKKALRRCPVCKKAILKKNSTIEHCAEVVAVKIASSMIGGSIPSPDYHFMCPKCKSLFLLVNGVFVPIIKGK